MRPRSNAETDEFVGEDDGGDRTAATTLEHDEAQDEDNDDAADASSDAGFERRRESALAGVFDALPGSSRLWSSIALACLAAALFAVLKGYTDAAFVVATLGVLAWFIEKRNRLQAGRENVAPRRQINDEDENNRVEDE